MEQLIVEGIDLTEFIGIPYVANRHPGNVSVDEFLANPKLGANCQLLTLGILARAGFYIDGKLPVDGGGRFGSKELWLDTKFTKIVVSNEFSEKNIHNTLHDHLKAFDVYFFLPPGMGSNIDPENLRKLHVGTRMHIDIGKTDKPYSMLHNAKPGPSALWSVKGFYEMGYSLLGIKRPIQRVI